MSRSSAFLKSEVTNKQPPGSTRPSISQVQQEQNSQFANKIETRDKNSRKAVSS